MKDLWAPTQEEITKWAYDADVEIEQDYEIIIYGVENIPLIIDLARDDDCPKQKFFFSCLYVFVGDIILGNDKDEIKELNEILDYALQFKENGIQEWIERSRDLITNPKKFDNSLWGIGSDYVYPD